MVTRARGGRLGHELGRSSGRQLGEEHHEHVGPESLGRSPLGRSRLGADSGAPRGAREGPRRPGCVGSAAQPDGGQASRQRDRLGLIPVTVDCGGDAPGGGQQVDGRRVRLEVGPDERDLAAFTHDRVAPLGQGRRRVLCEASQDLGRAHVRAGCRSFQCAMSVAAQRVQCVRHERGRHRQVSEVDPLVHESSQAMECAEGPCGVVGPEAQHHGSSGERHQRGEVVHAQHGAECSRSSGLSCAHWPRTDRSSPSRPSGRKRGDSTKAAPRS